MKKIATEEMMESEDDLPPASEAWPKVVREPERKVFTRGSMSWSGPAPVGRFKMCKQGEIAKEETPTTKVMTAAGRART